MKKDKEPSLLRKLIEIHWEQAKRRKALRLLTRQEWSVDFLAVICAKASKMAGGPVEIVIENSHGQKFYVRASDNKGIVKDDSGDIFNHLDDAMAVERFIRENSRR